MFDLKTQPWHIKVKSPEENYAAQKWLFSQGLTWCNGDVDVDCLHSKILSNYFARQRKVNDIEVNHEGFMHGAYPSEFNNDDYELELQFEEKIVVVDFTFPTVKESPEQKKIRELEETIAKAQEQINKLKGEM